MPNAPAHDEVLRAWRSRLFDSIEALHEAFPGRLFAISMEIRELAATGASDALSAAGAWILSSPAFPLPSTADKKSSQELREAVRAFVSEVETLIAEITEFFRSRPDGASELMAHHAAFHGRGHASTAFAVLLMAAFLHLTDT